jgi:hypothetical protein
MLIAIMLTSALLTAKPNWCFREEKLFVPRKGIQIIPADSKRKKVINILVPIDCVTGKDKLPNTDDELLVFLDFALPLDLKSGSVQGCGSIPDAANIYTNYRFNADYVALKRLAELWKSSAACERIISSEKNLAPLACTLDTYEKYRAQFMPRDAWDTLNNVPSKIPTTEELDERAKNDPKCK